MISGVGEIAWTALVEVSALVLPVAAPGEGLSPGVLSWPAEGAVPISISRHAVAATAARL
jgi:hypothetical protein